MSKAAIVGLLVAFVVELGAGVWLYREHDAVTQAENAVGQRESAVSSRETKATQLETANKTEAERLSFQEDRLEARDARLTAEKTRLDSVDRDLRSKSTELAEKERLLTKREEEDDDDDENQAFALSLVKDTLDRIREAIDRQNASGGGWPPGAQAAPSSPDGPPEPPAPVDAASLQKQLEQLEARYHRIEQSAPESESGAAGRVAALAELASECAELIARGSIDSLQIQAAIEVDLELLRDCTVRLGLPEDVVPKNLYELLESSRLAEIELLQVKKVAFLKERDTVFSGLYQGALAEAESTQQQIQDAKGKRPADPTLLFAKAILERQISPADAAALRSATSGEVRAAAINLRYAQLLKQQMAIRWWDIEVRQRLQDTVVLLSPALREQFRGADVRLTYIDLLSASTPSDPDSLRVSLQSLIKSPETVGEAVAQFISKRHSDPIRAAELQAALEEAYASENEEIVTAEDRVAFNEWLAGHLSPGKVYELVTLRIDPLLGIFEDLAAINDPRAPHADDRVEVEETRRALVTENARRPGDISAGESRLNSSLRVGTPEPQRLYGILRILVERTGTPELKRAWLETALDGLAAQLAFVDAARRDAEKEIPRNGDALGVLAKHNRSASSPSEIEHAAVTLDSSYKAIELRLNEHQLASPDNARVQALLTRVKQGYVANPPPNIAPASDWADPFVKSQIDKVLPSDIAAIRASTTRILSTVRVEQQRIEQERLAQLERQRQARIERERDAQRELEQLMDRYQNRKVQNQYPSAREVGTLSDGVTKVYYLGPASIYGRKNYIDDNGVRYHLQDDGILCPKGPN